MAAEKLELKFSGGGINPTTIKASEVADLIYSFEKSVIVTLQDQFPDIDVENYAYLSLSEIKNESLGLAFSPERATDAFEAVYKSIAQSINGNSFNNLPYPAIENLRTISKFSKRHNCDCDYIYAGAILAKLTPETNIEINQSAVIKGETTIQGKIQRVGGERPRVVFKDHLDNKIYFEVTEEIAKKLALRLYEDVALTGIATWDKKTYRVIDFKVIEITDLNKMTLADTFTEIRNITSNYWEEFDDIETLS